MSKNILIKDNVFTNCQPVIREQAIIDIGNALVETGYISPEYIKGMIERDNNLSTYIGNDVAIPHGEFESQKYVLKTGLAIMVYPEGIMWGENKVRIVIAIAAKNNEHLDIISKLAEKLLDMEEIDKIVNSSKDYIIEEFA